MKGIFSVTVSNSYKILQEVLGPDSKSRCRINMARCNSRSIVVLGPNSSNLIRLAILLGIVHSTACLDIEDSGYTRPLASRDITIGISQSRTRHSPEQIHLALAGPGSLAISWVTRPQVRNIKIRL